MIKYIEKEAARPDAFCKGVNCQDCPFHKDDFNGGCRIDDFIDAIPAADVRPVKRGEWLETPDKTAVICSHCGADWNEFDNETYRFIFCPNCGADMRGGDSDV